MSKPASRAVPLDRLAIGATMVAIIAGGLVIHPPLFDLRALMPAAPSLGLVLGVPSFEADPQTAEADPQTAYTFMPFDSPTALVTTLALGDTAELAREFQRMGYRLDADVDTGLAVPRLIVASLPPDLPALNEIDLRKAVFFQVLLPLVLQVNEVLLEQRARVISLRDRLDTGESLTGDEQGWLDTISAYYNVSSGDFDALLERVDAVPPSLALAQAALESGWGTSRPALEGNALFGQYTSDDGSGTAPGDYHIRTFSGLFEAVLSYAHNLNSHNAYSAFRKQRAQARAEERALDGYKLAATITRYSSRGRDYVKDVRRMIKTNDLDAFDHAWLTDGKVTRVVFNDT